MTDTTRRNQEQLHRTVSCTTVLSILTDSRSDQGSGDSSATSGETAFRACERSRLTTMLHVTCDDRIEVHASEGERERTWTAALRMPELFSRAFASRFWYTA